MNKILSICSVIIATGILAGCGSIKVTNGRSSEIGSVSVTKASKNGEGVFVCVSGANRLPSPLQAGESITVGGLLPGRYCVNGSQIDVPIIGEIEVFLR